MAKTNNNSLKLQRAVRSLFYDYQEKKGCLGTTYAQAACGCDNALQMWRGPKGDKGDPGPQGPKGDNAGSFLVSAEFVVNPAGQPEGSYLKLVLIDVAQQEQVVYVNLSELEDVYSAGNGIDITSMVIAAKLGAGLTFDQQGNITSAYQFCDGLDETSNVVKVKLDASNNILGFAGSGCKGLTATVGLAQSSSGVNLVLTGASGAVLSTIPLEGGTGITVQKNAQTGGFTWLVDFSDVISSTAGNNLTISDNKLYVGNSALSYTVGDGTFTLTNAAGGTSTVTLPTVVRSLDRADLVCEGENAPYLRLTFKRDNGQNLYQDVSLACLASALDVISDVNIDVQCETSRDLEPVVFFSAQGQATIITQEVYEEILEDPRAPSDTVAHDVVALGEAYTLELQGTSTSSPEPTLYLNARIISNYDSFWETGDLATQSAYIPLADVIAAGAEGYRLLEPFDFDPTIEWTNYPDRRVRIVVTVDSSGDYYVYTLAYYWDNGVSDKPTTDLVITNAGGDETRVDLNPAINHVGGEVKAVTNPDDRTRVTLRDWPHSEPFEYPAGFYASINAYASLDDVCGDNPLEFLSSTVVDNVFYTYYQSGTPAVVSMRIEDTNDDETINYIYQTYLTVDTSNNYACIDKDGNASVADLVSTGVVLYAYDNRTEKRLDDKQLYVVGELVEDGQGHPGIAIRAYLQGVKKVLRLGPSCSSDIPLADLGGISGAALDVQCEMVESTPYFMSNFQIDFIWFKSDTSYTETTQTFFYDSRSTDPEATWYGDAAAEGPVASMNFQVAGFRMVYTDLTTNESTTYEWSTLDLAVATTQNDSVTILLPNGCFFVARVATTISIVPARYGIVRSTIYLPWASVPRSYATRENGYDYKDAASSLSANERLDLGTPLPEGIDILDYSIPSLTINGVAASVVSGPPYETMLGTLLLEDYEGETTLFFTASPEYRDNWPRDTEEVLSAADFVMTDAGGTETRVDMKPLLAHIGGTVQNMPVGEVTSIPVLGNDAEPSTAEPGFYVQSDDHMIYIVGVSDTDGLSYETTVAEGKVTVCTYEQIKSIGMSFYYFDKPNTAPQYSYYLVADPVSGAPYDMQDILDAGDEGVELLAASGTAFPPVFVSDAPSVRIRATYTHVSDDVEPGGGEIRGALRAVAYPDCYTFELFGQAFALALCLAPSCDPCIDLTPAIGDAITSVSGTVSCDGTVTPFEDGAYINGEYSDASNNVIYGISESVSSNAQVTFELPQGTATLFPEVWIADPNDSHMSYSYVFSNGIPVSELTVGARFCSDERLHGYTPH